MNTQLGWTSIKQSKKLVEAGLDPNTADMYYFKDQLSLIYDNANYNDVFDLFKADGVSSNLTPCWSLGALINLMQPFYPAIDFESNDLWNISICAISYLFSDNEGYDILIKEKSLVDACVKTIIVLIEHNEIKQEETK